MKNKKAQLNISFGWIFAIIVGAFIIFLTIYGVNKFMGISSAQQSAEGGRSIEVLLNPLESSFESSQEVRIFVPTETRIISSCDSEDGLFGSQKIRTQQKVFNSYTSDENSIEITLENKYIFMERPVEGEEFFAFTRQYEFPSDRDYEFPFKIADLIYLVSTDKEYCFVNPSRDIEEDILDLDYEGFVVDDCSDNSVRICFNQGSDCDVEVYSGSGKILKGNEEIYFEGDALMYAGIFSDAEEYECQLHRLVNRAKQILVLYKEKSVIQEKQGCRRELEDEIDSFLNVLENYEDSKDIFYVGVKSREVNKLNSNLGDCKLW